MESANCKKVSIIVPVYKVEDVLARCLDSLCRQSLRDIEIILIDDASPDRCGEICEQYAAEDERIRVLHHSENRGPSAARNTGIAFANAEYLMFVDSDDWVYEDFCKLPYECAVQKQADLVMFDFKRANQNNSSGLEKNVNDGGVVKLTCLEAIELMFRKSEEVCVWNKLYSRELFKTISFPEGYLYEDVGTTHRTILLADTIYFLDKVLYFHTCRDESITTLKTEKASRDWLAMSLQRYHDLAAWGYPSDKLESLLTNLVLNYCMRTKAAADDADYVFCRKTLLSVKRLPEGFTWRRKIMFVLFRFCPTLFDLICMLWRKRWK